MTRDEILDSICKQGGLDDQATAIKAARAVVCSLRDRLSAEEAEGFVEALRPDLPELLACESHPHQRPPRTRDRLTEPEFAERVRAEAGLADLPAARALIRAVLGALSSRMGGEEEAAVANEARSIGSLASRPRSRRDEGDEE